MRMNADDILRQAHMTAHEYAKYGVRAYEELFGIKAEIDPQAAAIFVAGFMRTAAHDFDTTARER